MKRSLTLILGGARSGKSDYALQLVSPRRRVSPRGGAKHSSQKVLFVATANASDEEMQKRIAAHRAARPSHWLTLEAPLQVGKALHIAASTPAGGLADWVILDCVTLLASNILLSLKEPVDEDYFYSRLDEELDQLLAVYAKSHAKWVIISNEAGMGLVPPYPLGRYFRDGLGRANQRLAQAAHTVLFMVAGIPMLVKGQLPEK